MKTHSLLVYVPGMPYTPEHLAPQRELAAAAGALMAGGHETRILDFGTLTALHRMATPALRAQARRAAECGGGHVLDVGGTGRLSKELRSLQPLLSAARLRRAEEIGAVCGAGLPDFVVFLAHSGEEAAEALLAAGPLKAQYPGLRLAMMGRYAAHSGGLLLEASPVFDCVFTAECEAGLTRWAPLYARPEFWGSVPNLQYRDQGELHRTPVELSADLDELPRACYSPDVYPDLADGGKVKVFAVELSRGAPHVAYGDTEPMLSARRVRVKGAGTLCEEMAALYQSTRARAFHVAGRGAPSSALEMVALLLATHPMDVVYSRSAAVARLEPERMSILAASGCRALDFRMDTGSQRLLEDFYGHDFGVTPLETALRAAKGAGIYTAVRLTYPCPQDDYHTCAETLRVLKRCHPDAAVPGPPLLNPGSFWSRRADEFGYRVFYRHYARWASSMLGGRMGFRPDRAPLELSYRMTGWPPAKAATARLALVREIEELGIATLGSARLGLMARLAGRGGYEPAFIEELTRRLYTFDVEGAASLVGAINAGALAPAGVEALRPFKPLLAAVAN